MPAVAAGEAPGADFLHALTRRASAVAGGAAAAWAGNFVTLAQVGSTNLLAQRIAREYLAEGMAVPRAVLVAHRQTAGRGRHGHGWESGPGGAYVTLLTPDVLADELPTLPLLVPVALARVVDRWLGGDRRCEIQWPNDLLVGERKIAGVLIDGLGSEDARAAVIGFGVNVEQDGEALAGIPGRRPATSVALEGGSVPSLDQAVWELVVEVVSELDHTGDAPRAVELYQQRSRHRPGDRLRCRLAEETVEGEFLGFDRHGLLRLRLAAPGVGRQAGDELRLAAGELMP
ncbi:MAG TPA: biotin--[acetyl-CoA-carboxylase] ligase [Thermoanaerobaculia bacterium]|nr:biotin--[acetyl-CoA-carboxylase] ligase [Thermoanaerobaculia bacterium]